VRSVRTSASFAAAGLCVLAFTAAGCGGGSPEVHTLLPHWTISGGSADQLVRYWTQARMAQAKPYRPASAESASGTPLRFESRVWGPGPPTRAGARPVGRVFFEEGGVDYYCSGTAVSSDNSSVVLTSAHCVVDGGKGKHRVHDNWIFVPSFRPAGNCAPDTGAVCPYGRFAAKQFFVAKQWLRSGDPRYDIAAVAVEPRQKSELLTEFVGEVVGGFDSPLPALPRRSLAIFGYPAGAPFEGRLSFCFAIGARRTSSADSGELNAGCDMRAGADGGPWFAAASKNRTAVVGVTSVGTGKTVSSPYLGKVAKQLYDSASAVKVE